MIPRTGLETCLARMAMATSSRIFSLKKSAHCAFSIEKALPVAKLYCANCKIGIRGISSKKSAMVQIQKRFRSTDARSYDVSRLGQPSPESHPHLLNPGEVTTKVTVQEYAARRDRLLDMLPAGTLCIFPAAKHQYMTNDIPYRFRQNNDFAYFCGLEEPDSVLIFARFADSSTKSILYIRERNPTSELWDGPRTGTARASQFFGIEQIFSVDECRSHLPELISKSCLVLFNDIQTDVAQITDIVKACTFENSVINSTIPHRLLNVLNPNVAPIVDALRKDVVTHTPIPTFGERELVPRMDPTPLVHRLRLIKTPQEIDIMRKSCQLSGEAFIETMRKTPKQNVHESFMEATIEYECRVRGALRLAYPPVVASGNSANILHYVMNDSISKHDDLLLMDAGGEYCNYNADITRTWPINGKFTDGQRQVYQAVLNVQKRLFTMAGVQVRNPTGMLEPNNLKRMQTFAVALIGSALEMMGISSSYIHKAYPHMIGHYLGMDVHDVGSVPISENFRPGMIITIEPGIYLPNEPWVPAHLRGIGVRIEDDVLLTDDAPEILTKSAPKEIADLEKIIGTYHL